MHSDTGHTLSVAEKLKSKLISLNHDVNIEKVIALNDKEEQATNIQLQNIPDINEYDFIFFAAPVRAFNISPVISKYLSQLSSLEKRKIICFVTMFFPFKWMGGKNAISKMKIMCEEKNGEVIDVGIINWKKIDREKNINEMIENFIKNI